MSENEAQKPAEETAVEVKTEVIETAEATPVADETITKEAVAEKNEAPAVEATPAEAPVEEAKAEEPAEPEEPEEISYHAVEKEGEITAIWEMQGQKHIRTIDPRSTEGLKIFALFTSDIHETDSPPLASEATL